MLAFFFFFFVTPTPFALSGRGRGRRWADVAVIVRMDVWNIE